MEIWNLMCELGVQERVLIWGIISIKMRATVLSLDGISTRVTEIRKEGSSLGETLACLQWSLQSQQRPGSSDGWVVSIFPSTPIPYWRMWGRREGREDWFFLGAPL